MPCPLPSSTHLFRIASPSPAPVRAECDEADEVARQLERERTLRLQQSDQLAHHVMLIRDLKHQLSQAEDAHEQMEVSPPSQQHCRAQSEIPFLGGTAPPAPLPKAKHSIWGQSIPTFTHAADLDGRWKEHQRSVV